MEIKDKEILHLRTLLQRNQQFESMEDNYQQPSDQFQNQQQRMSMDLQDSMQETRRNNFSDGYISPQLDDVQSFYYILSDYFFLGNEIICV